MKEQWGKLHEMVSCMADRLGLEEKTRWYDTFLTNAHEMCGMLTHLNITRDPTLEDARRELERAIAGVDIEDIKGDEVTRTDMKGKLDDILKNYEW